MSKLSYFILIACLTGTINAQKRRNQPQEKRISLDDAVKLYIRNVVNPVRESESLLKELESVRDHSCRMGEYFRKASLSSFLPDNDFSYDDRDFFDNLANDSDWSCRRVRESIDKLSERGQLDSVSQSVFLRLADPLERKMQKKYGFIDDEIKLMRKKTLSRIDYDDKPIIKRNFFLKKLY